MEQNATFAHFITPIRYELLNFSRKNIKFCSNVYACNMPKIQLQILWIAPVKI